MNAYELSFPVTSLEAPLMLVDWERYYGEIIYAYLLNEIPSVEATLKEEGMWHPLFTPGRVTGIILAAGYSLDELREFTTNKPLLCEVALEALDILSTAGDDTVRKPARIPRQLPAISYLSGPAAKAIRTMRPLFP